MYTYPWYHWITFFYLYCFFGWIFESTYVSLKEHHFVNRGFLRLPMLPLYGTGAVMMLWVSLPVKDNLFLVYISGVIAATILEYITGYVMERLFKMKYWDYSNQRWNLNGYICLSSSIAWGFLTIFMTEIIHRPIADFVLALSPAVEFSFIAIISVLFTADVIKSTKEALDLGRALEAMTKMKAEAEEMQVQLALLKSETAQKAAELKDAASVRMADLKSDTVLRMADFKNDTAAKVADFKNDAALRVAELREEALAKAEWIQEETSVRAVEFAQYIADAAQKAAENAAKYASDAAQKATENATAKAMETAQKAAETAQKAAETARWAADIAAKTAERQQKEDTLSDRLHTLTEKRRGLSRQMSFYRKSILRGNPTASSQKFAEALKELRNSLNDRDL